MQALIYYLSLPILYGISLLPFWALHRISDVLFVLIYHVFGYRKEVVWANMKNSFPEKTDEELTELQRKFYRYFCDLMLEALKTLTISPATVRKHVSFSGQETYNKYFHQKQSVIMALGHYGNWELAGCRFAIEKTLHLIIIYHPFQNRYFNGLIVKMRTRLGNGLYPMRGAVQMIEEDADKLTSTGFIADQTPSPKRAFWMSFLNQDTPFFTGTGKVAKQMDYPVIYCSIKRKRRGYYDIGIEDLVPRPSELEPFDIVQRFAQRLEQDIQEQPEIWLWTHRRWKHKRVPEGT